MVFMQDSERASRLALESGIDAGLHLNFSELFTGSAVPASVRASHDRVCRVLRSSKYSLLLYRPWLNSAFRELIEAQQAEFRRLFGKQPSHLDGHQHMHLATNILWQQMLPAGAKVRRSFSFRTGEKSFVNRAYRTLVDRSLARRHGLTDYFFSITPNLSGSKLRPIVELAQTANVELMTHPAWNAEYEFLMSSEYQSVTHSVAMGTYLQLSGAN